MKTKEKQEELHINELTEVTMDQRYTTRNDSQFVFVHDMILSIFSKPNDLLSLSELGQICSLYFAYWTERNYVSDTLHVCVYCAPFRQEVSYVWKLLCVA